MWNLKPASVLAGPGQCLDFGLLRAAARLLCYSWIALGFMNRNATKFGRMWVLGWLADMLSLHGTRSWEKAEERKGTTYVSRARERERESGHYLVTGSRESCGMSNK